MQQAPGHIAERIGKARTAAAEMGFGFDRSDAFIAIARLQLAAGDIAGAGGSLDNAWTAVVGMRVYGDYEPDVRCKIAAVLAEAGDVAGIKATFAAALSSTARIGDTHWRRLRYAEIGLAQSRTGNGDAARASFASALETAGMEERPEATWVFEEIAKSHSAIRGYFRSEGRRRKNQP